MLPLQTALNELQGTKPWQWRSEEVSRGVTHVEPTAAQESEGAMPALLSYSSSREDEAEDSQPTHYCPECGLVGCSGMAAGEEEEEEYDDDYGYDYHDYDDCNDESDDDGGDAAGGGVTFGLAPAENRTLRSIFGDRIMTFLHSQVPDISHDQQQQFGQIADLPALQSDSENEFETGSSEGEPMPASTTNTTPLPFSSTGADAQSSAAGETTASMLSENAEWPDGDVTLLTLNFDNLDQHTTEELEHFCESKGILLKRNDKQKQDSEKGKERLTASTPASDGWKKKLITLIQQYRVQEEEEYDEMCGYEAEPFLATNMSANEFKEKANELLIGTMVSLPAPALVADGLTSPSCISVFPACC